MKIERIQIDGFGRLHDLDTGPDALGGLVVVVGPNEAGKSTLFTFLTTALYGFQPAARERNPHVPWGAQEAAGRVNLRLDGGGCGEVERRLRSQPVGRLTLDGAHTELRNHSLPWVEHVPRTVFRQVFAVTLGDLAGLDTETWARIQDNVVGSMGASDLRSVRAVAEELEREAGETWRPSRRGNQRLRDLQAEVRALRSRRAAAHDRDAKIRGLIEERDAVGVRLQEARERRQRDRLSLERAQSLLPVMKQMERIGNLREQGGERVLLHALPPDPVARCVDLEAERTRLDERLSAVEAELAEREEDQAAFDNRARAMLGRGEEIARLVGRVASYVADKARAVELGVELGGLESELDGVAASVLECPWRKLSSADVGSIPVELLRAHVSRLQPPLPAQPLNEARPIRGAAKFGGLALGLAVFAWGILSSSVVAIAAGAGLSAVALTLALTARRRRPSVSAIASLAADKQARAEIRGLLGGLPVRSAYLDQPGEALVAGLAHLQSLVRDHAQRVRTLEAARRRVAESEREAARLVEGLAVEGAHGADAVARALDLEVRRAERLRDAATAAEREIRRLVRERETITSALESLRPELAALHAAGERLAPGDAAAGLRLARARLAAHRRADELQEELQRAHPNLLDLEAQIRGETRDASESWALDDEQLAVTRARLETVEEEIEQLVKGSEALARDAAHLRERETVDAVDGEMASLRELEAGLVRERDRKWLLAKLLREADRRFRDQHQPDLLRRASSYLRHLTGGRYEKLVVDERADAHLFQVVGPGLPAPVALAPPVSTGALEQAYLSLRLAIVDHLDQGGERLPLFVDEVFVNWDRTRRVRGLEVLAGISSTRQVFVFTCHQGLAQELHARGGNILSLDR